MAWIVEVLRWLAFMALSFLPGAWLAFGFKPRGDALVTRILVALALTPIVLAVQFYVLRFLGLSFGSTAVVLVIGNLAALRLVIPALSEIPRLSRQVVLATGVALALPLTYLAIWMRDTQFRASFGHSWIHSSVAYLIANGQLRPEEPLLAGVRLAYPWSSHISQALYSVTLDVAPSAGYVWSNLLWLLAAFATVALLVGMLGGGIRAKASAVVLLSFAVNVGGYLYGRFMPADLLERYPIYGDFRFTPWLRKMGVYEPTVVGIGLFTGLLVLAAQPWEGALRRTGPPALALLLLGLAFLYPILLPAGCIVAASRIAVSVVEAYREGDLKQRWRESAGVLACIVLALGLGTGFLRFVTADRVTGSALGMSDVWSMKMKVAGAVLALGLPLVGLLWRGRKSLGTAPLQTLVLALSGAGCAALWVVLDIYHIRNEYKFMFPAAIALTPFAALAAERVMERAGRAWPAAAAVGMLALGAPAFASLQGAHAGSEEWPRLVTSEFEMGLDPSEPLSQVTDAVREQTPPEAVVVTRVVGLDLVALTGRAIYVPFDPGFLHGVGYEADLLVRNSRGYSGEEISARRAALYDLYEPESADARARALARLAQLGRPLVIVAQPAQDAELIEWLTETANAESLEVSGEYGAWVASPAGDAQDQ